MLVVISPAKTQDFSGGYLPVHTIPVLLDQSQLLIDRLRQMNSGEIGRLMHISDNLAELNRQRYHNFHTPFLPDNARQALLAFKGDVYSGIDTDHYSEEDFSFAQNHLRIISGLYGILKPLDLIQAYRLEMGTKLSADRGNDLYAFWGERLTDFLNQDLKKDPEPVLVNLASQEYFKALKVPLLQGRLLTVTFKEKKNNGYQTIGIHAKRARGVMTDFIIKNRITQVEDLRLFKQNGYCFRNDLSNEKEWIFSRD